MPARPEHRRRAALAALVLVGACTSRSVPAADPAPSPPATPSPSPSPGPGGGYPPGRVLCTLQDSRISESSGIVASSRSDHLFFTHNDSGDSARVFAIDDRCRTRAVYDLTGVTATDIEDIARGPGPVLWLADIGDNTASRRTIQVDRIDEPDGTRSASVPSTTFTLTYPDGPHDAETLLCDPRQGRLYIVTKSYLGRSSVYAAPLPLGTGAVLAKVTEVRIPLSAGQLAVTGGDVSPDGRRVVLRTYGDAFEAEVPPGAELGAAFAHGPGERVQLPHDRQGEGIAYTRDGRSLVTTSEGRGSAVHEIGPRRS